MLKVKDLPNLEALEAWKKTVSTKKQSRTGQAPKDAVNSIWLGLNKQQHLFVSAEHEKGVRKKSLWVGVYGGISTEAAIYGLRSIITLLEREGLPVESEKLKCRFKA